MTVTNTKRSQASQSKTGGSTQLSERDAACHSSTPIESDSSQLVDNEQAIAALTAILLGYMSETLSPDAEYLAMSNAGRMAGDFGVTEEAFNSVAAHVKSLQRKLRAQHPLSDLFYSREEYHETRD
jgi:hypothetical protein